MDTDRARSVRITWLTAWGRSLGHSTRAILLSGLLCSSVSAGESVYPAGTPAIPPGQEELIAAMLGKGAALPDGCQLAAGIAAYNVVTALYHCGGREIEFALAHPSQADNNAILTENFAITAKEGEAPDTLTEALIVQVRSKEADFEWIWPAKDDAVETAQGESDDTAY